MDALLEADTEEKIVEILYGANGVDLSYQRDEINYEDHERLFKLADRLSV